MGEKQERRLTLAAGCFAALLAVFALLLWRIQGVQGEAYWEKSQQSLADWETVPAARGRLLDRNGSVLAEDRVTWTVTVSEAAAARARLLALCQENGVTWDGQGDLEDVPKDFALQVTEETISGAAVVPTAQRVGSGTLAPHVLGRVGPMDADQWAVYEGQGYALNETVGKDGAEAAFESYLHGTSGRRLNQRDQAGNLTAVSWVIQPKAGRDVTLTLDKGLQQAAGAALENFLTDHPQAAGGAAVALDIETGGVLAMVSLPGYDTETFSADYGDLSAREDRPLLNRALQGLYAPGSTFKLVTAAAALEEGYLTPETQILDTGRYTYYRSPQPQCWLYRQEGRTHGLETVSQAIADSCNIFFYDAGRRVGIETLNRYAKALGLGEKTGIELAGEAAGVIAGPAHTEAAGGTWYEGSVLSAAIGQESNAFTPLQLAAMTAALAGEETRQVHLLQQVEGEAPYQAPLREGFTLSAENRAAIKEGMLAVTQTGSLAGAFQDLPFSAGAKTGSAQVAGEEVSNAVLVCFAPYEKPQIALALVAEQGGAGAALGETAAAILAYSGPSY